METVNHPAHYGGDTTYEAIKVIEAWDLGFCLGNVVKYICRAFRKNETLSGTVEDLKKARWYLDHEIQMYEKGNEKSGAMDKYRIVAEEETSVVGDTASARECDRALPTERNGALFDGLTIHGSPGLPLNTVTVAFDVLKERRRQIEVEGRTPSADDQSRTGGELWKMAMAYAIDPEASGAHTRTHWWPFADLHNPTLGFKPKDRRRDLVRAAALLLAEIERLDRARNDEHDRAERV
jgi:hypothetical protein